MLEKSTSAVKYPDASQLLGDKKGVGATAASGSCFSIHF